jgi:hypothetical protein
LIIDKNSHEVNNYPTRMKLTNKKKEVMDSYVEKDWSEISRLRMEFAAQNPDIIEKLFQGDATALEAFTNFGGIKATVTSVIKRDIS